MYIYKTINLINGKIYVGKRVFRKRDDNSYIGSGILLRKAVLKYGKTNFKKEILENCQTNEELCEREKYWIRELNSTDLSIGYNLSLGGDGGNIGKEGYIKTANYHRGRRKSKEFCQNLSDKLRGKKKTAEHIENVRQSLIGKKRSQEIVKKMSETTKQLYDNGFVSPVQKTVYQYNKLSGRYIQKFKSATEAGRQLNIDRKAITNNCVGKSKSSGGFIWSFENKTNIKND